MTPDELRAAYAEECMSNDVLERQLEAARAELAKHQESEFHPDWSMLKATQRSLRQHMALAKNDRTIAFEEAAQWILKTRSQTRTEWAQDLRALAKLEPGLVVVKLETAAEARAIALEWMDACECSPAEMPDGIHERTRALKQEVKP